MGTSFNVKFDVQQLEELSASLGKIANGIGSDVSVKVLNATAQRTFDEARKRMTSKVNLTDEYVRGKMTFREGTADNLQATISVEGRDNTRDTPLTRFDSKMVLASASSPKSKLKGNAALGIPVGLKQAGVKVEVARGAESSGFVPRGFLLPLNKGKEPGGNGFGVFSRRKVDGKAKHRYGPAVYQMFKVESGSMLGEVEEWLSDSLENYVKDFMERQLR